MGNFNTFQLILLGAFVALAAVGIFVFAFFAGTGGESYNRVVIWGTMDRQTMERFLSPLKADNRALQDVAYIEKNPETYNAELVEALAAGRGPDLFMLPHEDIARHEDKIIPIPFGSYSERDFKDTFIEQGELYLVNDGILGLPFMVDPLVMYWNRDIFSQEGLAQPPRFWDEFFTLSERLTERDQTNNITRATVAFGEYSNVNNAKELISALLMQSGTPLTQRNQEGEIQIVLRDRFDFTTPPAEAALRFYTEFSNPIKTVYSWNRSFSSAREEFLSGDLAIYFGFASEVLEIQDLNPNLNFDIAAFPQSRDSGDILTFGHMTAFAIPSQSSNVQGAFRTAQALTSASALDNLSNLNGLPPVRRDLLVDIPSDAYRTITFSSALIARGWFDPERNESNVVFRDMIESITSGRERISAAAAIADNQLENLLGDR